MYGYPQMNQGVLPQQQILQANGKASIDALRLAPNSSVLIADQTQPIIWRCVSDSLGNVSSQAFDITPHKDEDTIAKENLNKSITEIIDRLDRLEKSYESITSKPTKPANEPIPANAKFNARIEKPTGNAYADGKY